MSIHLINLDTIMCEFCSNNTEATARAYCWGNDISYGGYLCTLHSQEIASEFTHINLYPLGGYQPEYSALETYANPMTLDYTVEALERAARYGAPYPVCGDLTARKRIGKSWTGHSPDGEQW